MGRTSHLGSVNGDHKTRRSRRYDDHPIDWKAEPEPLPDSPPHPGDDEVHSSPRRTTSRRQRSRHSSSRTVDQNDYSASTMPAPPGVTLTRAATDAYRRPVNCLSPGDRYEVLHRRHSTRDASPAYGRTRVVGEYSGQSSAASGLAYGADDDDDDADHIEVVEEIEEEPARYKGRRRPSRDEYMDSSSDRRYHRRRRRAYGEDDTARKRHYAVSDGGSAAFDSSRTLDQSVESRRGRRGHVPDVIEDSRPPVSSKRPVVHKRHRSADVIQLDQPKPRRASIVRSSRSRAGSVTGGPSGVIGSIFGAPLGRQESVKEVRTPKKRVECVVCMGDINPAKVSKLKCGHSMCRSCLERSFKLSITDPQHMPPKCCTQDHIPLKHVDRLFDIAFKKTWNRKFAEWSTKNRVYCPLPKCGEWIKPANVRREDGRKVARCSRCRTKVCCSCGGRWHGAGACPSDPEMANLLAQAKEEGWKRCHRCKAMVELKEGCNHMTCRCGAEFCMICGVKWKNCDCPWFNADDRGGNFLDDMNGPLPHIRGDVGDIFNGNGPPAPAELRGQVGLSHGMAIPVRHRPRTYQEEIHLRRVQESRDSEMARNLQYNDDYYDEHNMMGGVGDVHGIGNAAGHYMNENYRRGGGQYRPSPPTKYDRTEHGDAYGSRGSRVETSRDQRLADRLAESRPKMGSPTAAGPIYPVGMMAHPPPPLAPPAPSIPQGPPARTLRHHSLEGEMYNNSPYTPRSERVMGGRTSRDYEDEAVAHSPPRSRRPRREKKAKSSDLAGLAGPGTGMNRVSQWRSFVEPGMPPDEETTAVPA
ncbi:hypothetical protein QQS21_006979 [Conoideocrella luteorostrata]|uniref:RBR-type E3 ubiquitin transferase n=1 Tax=Conoideocrella luteorostrata TaxID=1105319 RepID=A0AAJ0CMH3_9HYPO|nr:hypothetical protein QQS21_006979 [Conoideocrella luteorostrata]